MSFPASSFQAVPPPNYAAYADSGLGMKLGQMIGQIPDQYMKGRENARKIQMQQPILDPKTGEPSTDVNVVAKELLRRGGGEYAAQMLPFLQKQPFLNQLLQDSTDENVSPGNGVPSLPTPQVGRNPNARPGNIGTASRPVPQTGGEEGPTLNYLLQDAGKSLTQKQVFDFAKQIKINPNAKLTPDQIEYVSGEIDKLPKPLQNQVSGQSASAAEDAANGTSGDGAGNLPAGDVSGSPGGTPAPFMAPGRGQQPSARAPQPVAPVAPQATPSGPLDTGTLKNLGVPDAYIDRPQAWLQGQLKRADALEKRARLTEIAIGPGAGKADENTAAGIRKNVEQIQGLIGKAGEPTDMEKQFRAGKNPGESLVDFQARQTGAKKAAEDAASRTEAEKNYQIGKNPGESFVDFQARQAASKKGAEEEQSAVGKTMEKFAVDGLDAVGHQAMLDTVQKLGEKAPYGIIPKIQSELGRFGIETKGLSDIQAYERAIDYMAPQLRPIGSGRLLAPELTAFKAALGGLMTTPEGRRVSVENLKLLSTYKEAIGRIASDHTIPMRERMERIYKITPPHLKTLDDVRGQPAAATPAPAGTPLGAKQAPDGNWYVPDPNRPGKYLMVKH